MVQTTIGNPIGIGVGKISAKEFGADDAAKLAAQIDLRYLVSVSDAMPGTCIDGRACGVTLGGTKPQPGPSIAGGPSITAYAAAEMVGDYFGSTSAQTSLGRLQEIDEVLIASDIKLGGHVAKSAVEATNRTFIDSETGAPKTGCGASDQFLAILSRLTDSADAVYDISSTLLGNAFKNSCMQFVVGGDLDAHTADYNSSEVIREVGAKSHDENVEVLEGDHAEVLVVFNYIPETTVDRDALVNETGKQVFTVDMWYVDKLARVLAQGRPDAPEMFEKLQHAMVAFQVATYLTLCDGTHCPVLLKQTQPQTTTAPLAA